MRVVVVGAGIIGTTTAYRLKRRYPDLDLQIVAERLSPHTTSDICRLYSIRWSSIILT
jgi:L-2-hydroxyglutarate oxidase LhgO